MQTIFSSLGIHYLDEIRFEKARVKEKVILAWKKNKDPSKLWLSSCFEKEMKEKKHPKVELHYINNILKFSIFAGEDIGTHRYIGEYTGIVRKRKWSMIFRNFYCVEYPVGFDSLRKYVLDASKAGNFTRFINHSNTPNVEMRSTLFEDGLIHMVFIAKRLIRKGEELTLNYGKRFWIQAFKRPLP